MGTKLIIPGADFSANSINSFVAERRIGSANINTGELYYDTNANALMTSPISLKNVKCAISSGDKYMSSMHIVFYNSASAGTDTYVGSIKSYNEGDNIIIPEGSTHAIFIYNYPNHTWRDYSLENGKAIIKTTY